MKKKKKEKKARWNFVGHHKRLGHHSDVVGQPNFEAHSDLSGSLNTSTAKLKPDWEMVIHILYKVSCFNSVAPVFRASKLC